MVRRTEGFSRGINTVVEDSEKLALPRLARHWGISQSEVVARLGRRAEMAQAFEAYLR